jgi:hypothetical protein
MAAAAGLYMLSVVTAVLSLIGLEVFGLILFNDRRKNEKKSSGE